MGPGEGGLSRTSVGKGQGEVKEKFELSSLPGHEEEVLFFFFLIFNLLLSDSTDFNFFILRVPALSDLRATAFSAACRERSDVDVSAGLVGQPCAATASRLCRVQSPTLTGCGMGPDLRLLRSGGGAAETAFNGALGAAETAFNGAAETDFHGMIPRSRSLSQLRGDAGVVAREVCSSQDRGQVVHPVLRDVSVLAELEGVCVRRRKAGLVMVLTLIFLEFRSASCLRGGGRGKFSAGCLFSQAGCRFTSQEATRNWCQAAQGWCGHTFPPPGGS